MSSPFDYGGTGSGAPGGLPPAGGPSRPPFAESPTTANPFGGGSSGSPFGSSTSTFPPAPPPRGTSPTVWLIVGLVLALVAVATAVLFGRAVAVAVACWAVAGPVVIGLSAVHIHRQTQEQARPFSQPPSTGVRLLYGAVVVAALAGVVVSALRIADWVGRL